MFKKLAISLGIVSITTLTLYTIKVHKDNQLLISAVEDLANSVTKYVTDLEFTEIVAGLRDIDK
jgi:hypothetical protein